MLSQIVVPGAVTPYNKAFDARSNWLTLGLSKTHIETKRENTSN